MNPSIRRILVATDFSADARLALEKATDLAAAFDARVDVVYIWKPPPGLSLRTRSAGAEKSTLSDIARREASTRMTTFLGSDDATRERFSARIEVGSPCEIIVTLAATERHDLIVMGACGAGSSRTMLGSVTRSVLDSAPCPVLTMRRVNQASASASRPTETC